MIGTGIAAALELERLYEAVDGDPSFECVLEQIIVDDDAALADLIEADGRLRVRRGSPVELDRYLGAVTDLNRRPDPLDAAIDMALRSLARSGRADSHSIDTLVAGHPDLEAAIRDSAALNNAVWSTTRMNSGVTLWTDRSLPCDFGPALGDGRKRYQLRELIGEGAFGQVYLATDRQLSEPDHPALVSIKILPGAERTPWERERLADEATKARRISHVNVVRVADRGVSDQNEDFVVYEFVGGGDLGKWVRRSRRGVGPREAVRLTARIARGVHAAHMAGLVHCDLKPNNIVLTEGGEPKVADFGIAIRSEDAHAARRSVEKSSDPLGNLAFMSPQQFRMEAGALTIPSDVYALGGILYWLLSGALPNGATPEAIRRTHDSVQGRTGPPSLQPLAPGIDGDLEAICARAMAPRPEERYESSARLADDLEAWLAREPIGWRRPSLLRRVRLWSRRKPVLAGLTAALILLAAGSSIALSHLATVASERRTAAALAEARADFKEQARKNASAKLGEVLGKLKAAEDEGLATEVLPTLWLLEWVVGPKVLDDGDLRIEIWRMRVDVIRRLLEHEVASGRGDELQALQWESALGFWLTSRGDHEEAIPLLRRNLEHGGVSWRATITGSGKLEVVLECAEADRLTVAPEEGRTARLAEFAERLETSERTLWERVGRSPIHRMVLDRLRRLYGAELLDRPENLARIEQRIREIEGEDG